MKRFTQLFIELDRTSKTNVKVDALTRFLEDAPDGDKLWAIALLGGKRPRRAVTTTQLREWAAQMSGIPLWLLEESYHVVGDLAETLALVLPDPQKETDHTLEDWMNKLISMKEWEDEEKERFIKEAWSSFDRPGRFTFNKLITGGFRLGVSQKLMQRALARHLGTGEAELAHRLMGNWKPQETTFKELLLSKDRGDRLSVPYPFYLAYPLEDEPESLGEPHEWQIEYKWDGIRGQLIQRNGELYVWSRGEELVTGRFPEFENLARALPDGTVIDGEITAFRDGKPLPFNLLQTRIGRKKVGKKTMEKAPVVLIAYDLLEHGGKDIRDQPLQFRREALEQVVGEANQHELRISDVLNEDSWREFASLRENSREKHAEGLMLKRKDSIYRVGRKRGDWWKWKVDPLTIDAVLIYAMRGHGRRANLYTDYTFAVWDNDELVPFTKAYSGLTDTELKEVDRFVKKNTIDRFGPVRSVTPELVFELAFEGIAPSNRHKSGVALRFPRIERWRKDKPADEADTLKNLLRLLPENH